MARWGTSPSPAISLEVSTMTTRFFASSDSTRAISRNIVVLPTPGRPRSRMFLPEKAKSSIILMVPKTARPTRQVIPMTWPFRLRIAEMRCSVRSMPARLSSPNSPRRDTRFSKSSLVTSWSSKATSPEGNLASGTRPKSKTTSNNSSTSSRARSLSATRGGRMSSNWPSSFWSRSSAIANPMPPQPRNRAP